VREGLKSSPATHAAGEEQQTERKEKKMTNLWYQCRLRQGATETIGWIEARGARVGASVELKTDEYTGEWLVLEVFSPGMDGEALREKQTIDRKGLPSLDRQANR
jgi:hypothetical protein